MIFKKNKAPDHNRWEKYRNVFGRKVVKVCIDGELRTFRNVDYIGGNGNYFLYSNFDGELKKILDYRETTSGITLFYVGLPFSEWTYPPTNQEINTFGEIITETNIKSEYEVFIEDSLIIKPKTMTCEICEGTGQVEVDPLGPEEDSTMDFCVCQL